MQKNNLIKILNTFSRKEMTRFWEFSQSPYFNKHKEVRLLISYLNEVYPEFTAKRLERTSLFRFLFKNEKHNQKKLALLFTYSFRLLERFLKIEQLNKEPFLQHINLLKQIRQRGIYPYYEKKFLEAENYLNEFFESIPNENLARFQLGNERNHYFNQLYKTIQNQELESKQDLLDRFYFSEKLKDACELEFRNQILKQNYQYEPTMLNEVLKRVENAGSFYSSNDSIQVYSKMYKLLTVNDMGDYFEIITVLKKTENAFPKPELQNIYNYLQNYCIRQINTGNPDFLIELFKIYKSQMEKGLLLVDGYLPEFHYKNIVTTGLRLDENEWVYDFIEGNKALLKPSVIENAYSYNLAAYYYNTKQYSEVLNLLIKIEYTDIRYNLGAKSLLLKTYFDLEEEEAFLSLTDSFRQFLKRNKILSEFQKEGYYNLIKFARKVFQIKSLVGFESRKKLKEDFQKIKLEIESSNRIFNQSWLEGRIEVVQKIFK